MQNTETKQKPRIRVVIVTKSYDSLLLAGNSEKAPEFYKKWYAQPISTDKCRYIMPETNTINTFQVNYYIF